MDGKKGQYRRIRVLDCEERQTAETEEHDEEGYSPIHLGQFDADYHHKALRDALHQGLLGKPDSIKVTSKKVYAIRIV